MEWGGKFTLSDDSHSPDRVAQHYQQTYKYLKDLCMPVYYLERDVLSQKVEVKPLGSDYQYPHSNENDKKDVNT